MSYVGTGTPKALISKDHDHSIPAKGEKNEANGHSSNSAAADGKEEQILDSTSKIPDKRFF